MKENEQYGLHKKPKPHDQQAEIKIKNTSNQNWLQAFHIWWQRTIDFFVLNKLAVHEADDFEWWHIYRQKAGMYTSTDFHNSSKSTQSLKENKEKLEKIYQLEIR